MNVVVSHRSVRVAFLCLFLVRALAAAAGAQGATPAPPSVASCPQVGAALSATIDTKKVKPGELFRFATLGPVSFGGITIPTGTNGIGLIATLDHSKSQGHSGYLVLEARYLENTDGSHVPVAFIRAGSSDAGLIGYLPYYIGTAAGVYNTFHHGKDAAVVAGTHFSLIVGDAYYAGDCRLP